MRSGLFRVMQDRKKSEAMSSVDIDIVGMYWEAELGRGFV